MEIRLDGKKLIRARFALGMSQKDLAKAAGVNATTIFSWEAGKPCAAAAKAKKICDVLGLDVADVILFAEDAS